ncbi:hypothetical protein [Actinoallomurus rhizosphaericola]|uniref:hypothetical protein n=1 Tax=Actinoallomurus rhizosphaericola TaxID=2952536 RepID=UPI002090DEE7|nr:hypothetical protein [Actinoallomurus rhizosphaericola]MCO5994003.1 hypothetical protein [Actinoallomurus rhizosphaericola]
MPLSRVAIAAVFFIVGALIVFPMLTDSSQPSRAASSTPLPSVSASATASPTRSSHPTHKASHKASPTHSPTRPSIGEPLPSAGSSSPLSVEIGKVRCPGRTVQVSVVNGSSQAEDYAILTDGSISVADRIPAGATRRSTVNVKEDRTTTVAVTWRNLPVKSVDRRANCVRRTSDQTLPHTGPDSGMIVARVATGIAVMLTGVIIFWYGRQWPRRHGKMFDR